jgi:hypothetical protein
MNGKFTIYLAVVQHHSRMILIVQLHPTKIFRVLTQALPHKKSTFANRVLKA